MRHLILCLLCIIQFVHAKPLSLDKPLEYIGQDTVYYVDEKGSESFTQISRLPRSSFQKVLSKADSRLFTQDTIWYKFQVENNQPNPLERYIIFDIAWLDDIQIFIQNNQHLQQYNTGNNLLFEQRSIDTRFLNIKANFQTGISDVYIRVKTQDPFVVPVSILDKESIELKLHKNELFHSMLYSVITVMVIFNLILFLVIGERAYLYYALFLFAFEFMHASYNNYTYALLWADWPIFQDWIQSTSIYMYSIFGLIFVQSFLSLEKLFPNIYKLHKIVFGGFLVIAILSSLYGYHIHVMGSIFLSIIFSIYTFCVTLYSLLHGNSYAKFFLLGTIAGMTGTSITALSAMAFIEFHEDLYNAVDYGMMIDTILISVALAKKYKVLHEKIEQAHTKVNLLNVELEQKVFFRTLQLEEEVKKKNLLLKEIFHRVKNNMQIISSLFMLQENKIEDKNAQKIISDNISRIKVMSILHEKLYKNDNIDKRDFQEYLEDIIPTILQSMSNTPIKYHIKSIPIEVSSDDLISFGLIFNELITNSVKYGFTNTDEIKILILIEESDKQIVITFKDNGQGMNSDTKRGFGSKLIQSLVEYQMNGSVEYVDSEGFECRMQFLKKYLLT